MTWVDDRGTEDEILDTSHVPFRIEDDLWIPSERYYDPAFFEAEKQLWYHSWQHACHETEIPDPGDFTEYRILDQSIMLIRQQDGSVRGFYNACRHRGTALACGTGTFQSDQVVCPFHGWRWNLDGTNSFVYSRSGFRPDTVEKADLDLPEVKVGLKWGFVWINLDLDAVPLDEYFKGADKALDPHGFDKMRVKWWHQIEFEANWKIAHEAFLEAYHIMQAHPEMAMFLRDDAYNAYSMAQYNANFAQGHMWTDRRRPLIGTAPAPDGPQPSPAEMFLAQLRVQWQGAHSMATAEQLAIGEELIEKVPHEEFFPEFFKRVYTDAAARGVPLPPRTEEMTGHWSTFPSFTGVVAIGTALAYRARPHATDPNKCVYDFWALEIPPEGTETSRPQIADENAPTWDDLWFVQQDASNIERMQTGIRSRAHTHNRLAVDLERMITNWHRNLDQLLARHSGPRGGR